jgi:plastocyanin
MTASRRDLLAGAVAAAAAMALPARAATTHRVNIAADKTSFDPAELKIMAGDTVRWRNRSIVEHSVVCDPGKAKDRTNAAHPPAAQPFDSGLFADDAVFEHTFTVPGTYRYFCREHEAMGMVGTVIVA